MKTDQLIVVLWGLAASVWASISASRFPRHGKEIVAIEGAYSVDALRKWILIDHGN